MKPVRQIQGRAVPLGRKNVDTDMIIAAQHLKTISRLGLGRHAFAAIRAEPGNVFDDPAWRGAPILIAGDNFGCGSSREHAVWALADMGVKAVIAPSFSDIFAGNAFKNGLAAITLGQGEVDRLLRQAANNEILIDLEKKIVSCDGEIFPFDMDPFRRDCLLEGRDEIALTLLQADNIRAYEQRMGV